MNEKYVTSSFLSIDTALVSCVVIVLGEGKKRKIRRPRRKMRKCFEEEGRNDDKFIRKPKIQSGARLKNFLKQFFSSSSCTDKFWTETFYYGKKPGAPLQEIKWQGLECHEPFTKVSVSVAMQCYTLVNKVGSIVPDHSN